MDDERVEEITERSDRLAREAEREADREETEEKIEEDA